MKPVRLICRASIALFIAAAAGSSAKAAPLNWDADANPVNGANGGTGVWNATNANWYDGVNDVVWPNIDPNADTAIFGGTAGTVSLGEPIFANGLQFDVAGYLIDNGGNPANTLTLSGANPAVVANADATISAIVAGAAGFTKSGAGVLTLSGANTYGGVTAITAGTLSFDASANLGGAAAGNSLSISNNAILRFTGATTQNLGANRSLAIGAGGATIEHAGTGVLQLSAPITAAAGNTFTKTGNGTLLLTGNSPGWSGNVVVNAGTLQVGNAAATQFPGGLGASSPTRSITVNTGAILDFQGRDSTGNTPLAFIVNGGTVRNTSGFTRMGNLTLNGGTIHVIQGNSTAFQAMTFNGDVTVTGTSPSQITTTGGGSNGIHLEKSGGPIFTIPDITGDAVADLSIAVPLLNLSGNTVVAQGFTKNGAGTLLLTGANNFTGTMVLNEGNVIIGTAAAGATPVTFGTTAGTSASLTLNVATRLGNVTQLATGNPGLINGTGAVSLLGDRTYNVGNTSAATDLLVTVPINNGDSTGRALTKTGAGTVQFDGVNTFTGTFNINDGTVVMNASNSAAGGFAMSSTAGGNPRMTINAGVTYRLGGNPAINATGNGAVIDGAGSIGLFGDRAFIISNNAGADDLVISATIANGDIGTNRIVRKEGVGRMVMQGDNTYSGATEIHRGALVLDYSASTGSKLSDTTGATNLRGGTLILSGNASGPVTETVTSFGVLTATSNVQLMPVGGQTLTFNLNGISRAAGQGVADFRSTDTALGVFQTTTTNNFQGLLGAYATFNGNRFATVNGGVLAAAASAVQSDRSQWDSAQNVVVDGALSGPLRTTAINSLVFDAAIANTLTIDNSAGSLNVRSGGVLISANVGANNTAITGGRLEIDPANGSGAGELVLANRSTGTLSVAATMGANSAPLSTAQHVTFAGSGLIEVTGQNLYLGSTNVHGNVRISGGNAFSDFTQLTLSGGGDMTANGGALLNLNGTSEGVGQLSGGAFASQGASEIQLGTGGILTINGTSSSSYSGLLTGSGTVIKRGGGTQTLTTNAHAFTGELHVLGGLVDFTGNNAGATGVSRVMLRGGSLLSQQDQGASVDKIANGATIGLEGTTGNGLRVTSNQNATRTETVDKLELGAGANVFTLTNTSGGGTAITVLNFANATDAFSRSNNATLLARGGLADFGGAGTSSIRVTFASGIAGDLVGAGGAAGTTNISILPFAVGGAGSITNPGDTFFTIGTNGLRPLNTTTEFATSYAAAAPGDNLSLSATAAGLAGKTVNSLRIDNSAGNVDLTGTAATGALSVASGALLVSAGANANDTVISGFDQVLAGASDATPDELVVHVTTTNAAPAGATLTLNSPLGDNGGAATSLTKSGDGTLILGASNSYSGTTTINQGVLQFSAANQLGADGTVRLAGGTLQWGAGNTVDVSAKADTTARTIELIGPSPFLSPAGAGSILNAGNRFDVGANNVTLANPIGNGGVGALTKVGAGTLTLSVSPNYSGPTLVREGIMNFATVAPGSTPALYLVADTGSVSSSVSSGLNLQSLIVGAVYAGTGNSTGTLTVNGGAVSIGDGSGDDFVLIGYREAGNGAVGTTRGTVDFQNASSVNINVGRMILGQNAGTGSNTIDGDLTLSNGTNTVVAHQVIVGNSPGPGNEGAGVASSIALGTGTTVFAVDSLTIGGMKTNASMTLGAGGNFTLRGMAGGSSAANVFIGDNDASGTGTNQTAALTVLDLSAGTADVKANLLVIGRHAGGGTGGGSGKGTLLFNAGTFEAQTIQLAVPDFRGNSTNDASTVGIITQGGGTLRFQDLSKGNGTATYNWNAGTISNATGLDAVNQNVTIGLLTAAPHTFSVDAGRAATFRGQAGFSGVGSLTKSGNGTLILEGASTFAGGTSVEAGTLLANNAAGSALGTGPISVSVAGTFGGTGSVSGAVTVAAGGTLAPGASIESLGTGALTMDGGSTFALEIDTTNLLTDLLASSGALTLDLASSPTLTLADLGGNMALAEGTVFPFLTYSSWNGGFFSVGGNSISDDIESFTFGANEFAIDYNRDGNSVALVVVPEPSTAAMLLGGLAAMVGLRRRRFASSV